MYLELSVSNARTKAAAIAELVGHGYEAETGAIRLAYPFTIAVPDVDEAEVDAVRRLVSGIDPTAGMIETQRLATPS